MKNPSIRKFALLLFTVFLISSCSTSDDDNNTDQQNQQAIAELQAQMRSGDWKITKFIDSGEDELHHFQGYTFNFNENGVLVATNGTITHTGTWNITGSSNSSDDSNDDDDLDFNINFNLTNDFEELNDDWDILSRTATKVELRDVSGGNGGTDLLTFEKI